MLVTLRNSADKLNALLARLARYGPKETAKAEPFDLANLAKSLQRRFASQHPVLLLRAESSVVTGDSEAFEQALVHLIQNAIDASDADSAVSLEAYSDGVCGKINVIDSGRGMRSCARFRSSPR